MSSTTPMHRLFGIFTLTIAAIFAGCGTDDGNPDTSSSSSGGDASADGGGGRDGSSGGAPTAVDEALLEDVLDVNALYFELAGMIGKKVWVHGFFGDARYTADGRGFIVDNPQRLIVDEAFPHHSFARIEGTLPPSDWDRTEVMVYGEIKDLAAATGAFAVQPTPLVVVEKSVRLNTVLPPPTWGPLLLAPDATTIHAEPVLPWPSPLPEQPISAPPPPPARLGVQHTRSGVPLTGTQADPCDRSVIISGGVDASNNHSRYKDNVAAKFKRMKEIGFSDDQIEVFYNDGGAIDVGGANVTDGRSSKQKLKDHFEALAADMTGSCTLTIFVTDHGTGYSAAQGYHGARPALSGAEATGGKQFAEGTFKMDARAKVYRATAQFEHRSGLYFMAKDATGKVKLFRRSGGAWSYLGTDANGDGIISETEANTDFDGDGAANNAGFGFRVEWMNERLSAAVKHRDNEWDTDGDGVKDVRLRWDGTRYVAERFVDGAWKEMGRDTNGDFVIDGTDGGVDWNLDGDKDDTAGFHEGINLWGTEVLWDDELAALLKPLSDKGVHIMMEMVSCFSGGFVPNLEGIVENVVAGSSEDTKHYNRSADGKVYAADELAFLDNLAGIDSESWTKAWDAAIAADDAAAAGSGENQHTRWETPQIATESKFQALLDGEYNLQLELPPSLAGQVYDFEIILGLQQPRWLWGGFPDDLPAGYDSELIGGGIRVFSSSPIPSGFKIKVKGTAGSQKLRIGLTDVNHKSLGYTMAQPGTVVIDHTMHIGAFSASYRHFDTYSEIYGEVTILDGIGQPVSGATVTMNIGGAPATFVTDAQGKASYVFTIYSYGTYIVKVTNVARSSTTYEPDQDVASQRTVNVGP